MHISTRHTKHRIGLRLLDPSSRLFLYAQLFFAAMKLFTHLDLAYALTLLACSTALSGLVTGRDLVLAPLRRLLLIRCMLRTLPQSV